MSETEKHIIVIGGPNGAGKTTSARALLPRLGLHEFVNADEIARSLSPEDVEGAALSAGRTMLERMNSLLTQNKPFAFETTCSGHGHVRFLERAKQQGWTVELFYLWLSSPELAIQRVSKRVALGGHHIPDDVVIRRHRNSLKNLLRGYLPVADSAALYDNSGEAPVLIAEKPDGQELVVYNQRVWSAMQMAAK
jgi:predicted ABC-type ATPase